MGSKSRSGAGPPGQSRTVQISKALSWLLRHGAAKERIPMTPDGYVSMRDVLGWGKIKGLKAGFEEIVEVVEGNEKQRFGLRYEGGGGVGRGGVDQITDANIIPSTTSTASTTVPASDARHQQQPQQPPQRAQQQTLTQTQLALSAFHSHSRNHPANPAHYSIRAVQGHSIKTIEATNLLTPILLLNPLSDPRSSIPSTCVHGTFRAAWPAILRSGGLRPMSRVHVHFAEGPGVADVLIADAAGGGGDEEERGQGGRLKEAMVRSQVVSGMRSDAEVLVYVDVRRSIEVGGMEWWRSENGVLLTEGVDEGGGGVGEQKEGGMQEGERGGDYQNLRRGGGVTDSRSSNANARDGPRVQKIVPMRYWDVVVEVGLGLGVLWRKGEGVVKEIPPDLLGRGKGKIGGGVGKVHGKSSGKGKPKLRVERESNEVYAGGDDD